jgi:hypothetical protein
MRAPPWLIQMECFPFSIAVRTLCYYPGHAISKPQENPCTLIVWSFGPSTR